MPRFGLGASAADHSGVHALGGGSQVATAFAATLFLGGKFGVLSLQEGRHSDEGLEVGDHPLGRHPPLYAAHANKIMIASEQFQKEQFQTCNVIDSNNELQVIQCC
jgi:hypothetical protein